MTAVYLVLAIVFEAAWAVLLKVLHTEGGAWRWALVVALIACSMVFLALALRRMDLSVAYALWVGGGMVLITAASVVYLKESATPARLISIALIAAGAVGLHLFDERPGRSAGGGGVGGGGAGGGGGVGAENTPPAGR
ncbi:MAG: multidrug efflux SMR transporter [Phycisphaeraceae bacterium]|nr:MAG: multidrug efflux SMR transporter [Phycisphaeraceae bacterium]